MRSNGHERPNARRAPLRVALYTPSWPGGSLPNGIVTYTAQIVPALREAGAEVFILSATVAPGSDDPRVRMASRPHEPLAARAVSRVRDRVSPGAWAERLNAAAIVREVHRLEREGGLDVVEMEESFGWCEHVARRCAAPVVARLHGPWFLNGPLVEDPASAAFIRRVRREGEALRAAAGVTAPSRDVLERTRRRYGLALEGAEVIPYPIQPVPDSDRWNPDTCEPATILFVGRFDSHKGGDTIIEAFAQMRASRPGVRLLFAGPDRGLTDPTGRVWSLPEFIADRLPGAADRAAVECLGPQPPESIRSLRRRAAVTVVPSRYETFGYTLGEAMAQGCPVVASGAGALVELVQDQRNGLLTRPGDPGDLARAILRLLGDRELASRLGRAALADCTERYDPGAIARRTLEYYGRVLDGARAGRRVRV